MKRVLIAIICLFAFTSISHAQNSKLDGPFLKKSVIKVYGDCELCKTRIEKTARKIPGVRFASWDFDSQKLLVEYIRTRTNPEKIQQAIAASGCDAACCCHGARGK